MRKLNLGSGNDIKEGWDNVDIQEDPKLTMSFDFNVFPYPIDDNTYDYVLMQQVIEHLEKPDLALLEVHRICKNGATIEIVTAYYNNKAAYNDMQHMHYFSDRTFEVFVNQNKVIQRREMFRIKKLELEPTSVGRFFPQYIREKLSLFIGGMIGRIFVELEVVK